MAARTTANPAHTDVHGIERTNDDNVGALAAFRAKHAWFDHIMRMQERYSSMGGNQYAAGITYFSVLSIFPILMLLFAALGFVLAGNPQLLNDVNERITESVDGSMSETLTEILNTAVKQRGSVAGIGALTALWSGLGWMHNLRYGVSKMWKLNPVGGNFLVNKLRDFVGLIILLLALVVAFGVTAVGASGLTVTLLERVGLSGVPGISYITYVVAVVVGVLSNYLVFFWLVKFMPRTTTPLKSCAKAALVGAIGFEILKQFGSLFFSNALSNPAGATFGPIIGVMALLYFVWRILLYSSAWAATTEESLALVDYDVPEPAVIRVRREVRTQSAVSSTAAIVGAGAVAGGLLAAIFGGK
ncbi:inner membrane protein YhjD [Corynebacterium sp. 11A]|uniref:inner membrane protein YhjD n=1 Tax=Corynebacterium sp. 11A TaxID=2080510 RepID=UPI00124F4D97|nr:inner membrane protein YhjD [Corynebacterium sp. 11A]